MIKATCTFFLCLNNLPVYTVASSGHQSDKAYTQKNLSCWWWSFRNFCIFLENADSTSEKYPERETNSISLILIRYGSRGLLTTRKMEKKRNSTRIIWRTLAPALVRSLVDQVSAPHFSPVKISWVSFDPVVQIGHKTRGSVIVTILHSTVY